MNSANGINDVLNVIYFDKLKEVYAISWLLQILAIALSLSFSTNLSNVMEFLIFMKKPIDRKILMMK